MDREYDRPTPKKKSKSQGASLRVDTPREWGEAPIIVAECLKSRRKEYVYGDEERSIKRALATLTDNCSCGATFHFVAEDWDGLLN